MRRKIDWGQGSGGNWIFRMDVTTSINGEGGGDAFLERNFCAVGSGAPSPLPLILMEYATF